MRLLVLAGGFGTRLRGTIADTPKALAPVGGIPFLKLQLENWLAQGLSNFTFLLHHQADQIISFLKSLEDNMLRECEIQYLVEPVPMNTGGAIAYAVGKLKVKGSFLVANADTWLGDGVSQISSINAPAMTVVELINTDRYGRVQFDSEHYITSFHEKSVEVSKGWVNAGLCHLSVDLFNQWNGNPFSLETELFGVLAKHRRLKAVPLRTSFIDIGVPEDYKSFCSWKSNSSTFLQD